MKRENERKQRLQDACDDDTCYFQLGVFNSTNQ